MADKVIEQIDKALIKVREIFEIIDEKRAISKICNIGSCALFILIGVLQIIALILLNYEINIWIQLSWSIFICILLLLLYIIFSSLLITFENDKEIDAVNSSTLITTLLCKFVTYISIVISNFVFLIIPLIIIGILFALLKNLNLNLYNKTYGKINFYSAIPLIFSFLTFIGLSFFSFMPTLNSNSYKTLKKILLLVTSITFILFSYYYIFISVDWLYDIILKWFINHSLFGDLEDKIKELLETDNGKSIINKLHYNEIFKLNENNKYSLKWFLGIIIHIIISIVIGGGGLYISLTILNPVSMLVIKNSLEKTLSSYLKYGCNDKGPENPPIENTTSNKGDDTISTSQSGTEIDNNAKNTLSGNKGPIKKSTVITYRNEEEIKGGSNKIGGNKIKKKEKKVRKVKK